MPIMLQTNSRLQEWFEKVSLMSHQRQNFHLSSIKAVTKGDVH